MPYVPLRPAFRYRSGQCRGMLASCASFKLRATAPNSSGPAIEQRAYFMRQKANENKVPSVAATTETAWPLLSVVGPLRRTHKIRARVRLRPLAQTVLIVSRG